MIPRHRKYDRGGEEGKLLSCTISTVTRSLAVSHILSSLCQLWIKFRRL